MLPNRACLPVLLIALASCTAPGPRTDEEQVAAYRAQGFSQEEAVTKALQDKAKQTQEARAQSDQMQPGSESATRPETSLRQLPNFRRFY